MNVKCIIHYTFLGFFFFLTSDQSNGQTYIQGNVSGTWDKSHSPYIIENDITILDNSNLKINPGTTVLFKGQCKFIVYGLLNAVGTQTDSIKFSSFDLDSTWGGIRFINADSACQLQYCIVEHGKTTGDSLAGAGGGIFCQNASITISHCLIRFNASYGGTPIWSGGGICSINSQPLIKGNFISYNHGWGGAGGGIFCINSSPIIINNFIVNNSSYSTNGSFTPTGGGIYCERSSALIENNLISHNDSYEGGGIACMEEPPCKIINNTIVNNTSKYTSPGGVVAYWSPVILKNNIIYYNGWDSQVIVHYVSPAVTYNDIENYHSLRSPPDYNFGLIPNFVDTSKENYHLNFNSPCIDAGDPNSNFDLEPSYNGKRINLGMFGNTPETAVSHPKIEVTKTIIKFDTLRMNTRDTISFLIRNSGTTRLNIDSIYLTSNSQFAINYSNRKYVLPSDSMEVNAIFKPDIPGSYYDYIIIQSNDKNNPINEINLLGTCYFENVPLIYEIADVPNDEGGWVKVSFTRSKYDTDSLLLGKISSPEIYSIEINDSSGWIAAASLLAYGKPNYTALVHTTKDSTVNGPGLINFRVIAGMEEGNFASAEKSGCSVDNLAPSVPNGLSVKLLPNSKVELKWRSNSEKDFYHYIIYKSADGVQFSFLAESIDTAFIDNISKSITSYYYKISAIDYSGNKSKTSEVIKITITNIKDDSKVSFDFSLLQNYPNPFNPTTEIKYSIPNESFVAIKVYDVLGKEIKTLVLDRKPSGYYSVDFNASNLPSGVYFYRMQATPEGRQGGSFVSTKKFILLK